MLDPATVADLEERVLGSAVAWPEALASIIAPLVLHWQQCWTHDDRRTIADVLMFLALPPAGKRPRRPDFTAVERHLENAAHGAAAILLAQLVARAESPEAAAERAHTLACDVLLRRLSGTLHTCLARIESPTVEAEVEYMEL